MARLGRPAPEAEDIRALAQELIDLHHEADDQIKLTRETREMREKISIAERYTDIEVRDPSLTDECFRVPAAATLNPPTWTITNDDPSPGAERNTTLREQVTAALFDVCGRRDGPPSTHAQLVDACIADGGAWAKFAFIKDIWLEAGGLRRRRDSEDSGAYIAAIDQKRKEAGPPFLFQSADPLTVYPFWSGGKLGTMVEIGEAPFISSLRQYGLTASSGAGGGNYQFTEGSIGKSQALDSGLPKTVKTYGYWDEQWYCYLIDAPGFDPYMVREPFQHGYGRVPFFNAPGLMMNHWRNRKVGWGVAQTKSYLIRYMNYLATVHADVAARDAYTPAIHQVDPEHGIPLDPQGNKKTRDEKVGLREVVLTYGPNDRWLPFPVQDTAPALREQMALVRDMIQSSLTPKVVGNIANVEGGAGFGISQVIAETKIAQHPFLENLSMMYVDLTRFAWELIGRKLGARDKVWVFVPGDPVKAKRGGYLGLSKADLTDAVQVEVEIDPERPTAKLVEGRYWVEQVGAKFASRQQAIEAQGRNFDEVEDGLTEDNIRETPWYKKFTEDEVAQAMGMGHLMELAQQAQQVAQTGVTPTGQPAMGTAEVPDQGKLAQAPNQEQGMAPAPSNGNLGTSPGAVQPMAREVAGAAAGGPPPA